MSKYWEFGGGRYYVLKYCHFGLLSFLVRLNPVWSSTDIKKEIYWWCLDTAQLCSAETWNYIREGVCCCCCCFKLTVALKHPKLCETWSGVPDFCSDVPSSAPNCPFVVFLIALALVSDLICLHSLSIEVPVYCHLNLPSRWMLDWEYLMNELGPQTAVLLLAKLITSDCGRKADWWFSGEALKSTK